MTLKQLEVFVAIAETGSFSKGAEKTEITQSTASQHILGLEKELGVRLFDRGREGALLTEAGKLFFSRAGKIISDCAGSRTVIRRFLGMEDVTLRVGASDVSGALMIPAVLKTFQNNHPKVRLEVIQGNSRSVLRQLADEEIELGFVGGRFEDERITFEQMGEDSLVCAVSPDLSAGRKGSLSQAQLCKVPMISREDGSGTQKAVYDAIAGTWINKDSLSIVARLGSSDAIRRALLNGAGYAFISTRAISEELANGQLTSIRIPGVQITRKFYAARREGRELSPAAASFLGLMFSQWR
ncbi:MAG TPA: selenium metabolism-associated LysR family transcriptional regulator [Dongiaceae bacterium]|nr:selenium metabolism-associated LysR family transcriptional regulator [Dongiaceae bacterium]